MKRRNERSLTNSQFRWIQEQAEDSLEQFALRFAYIECPPLPVELIASALYGLAVQNRSLRGHGRRAVGALSAAAHVVTIASNCNWHQRVFAIAHEIGHHVLHEGNGAIQLRPDESNAVQLEKTLPSMAAKTTAAKERCRESEANQFAAALLMPRADLLDVCRRFNTINADVVIELAQMFQVSTEAMLHRVTDLYDYLLWEGPRLDLTNLAELESTLARPVLPNRLAFIDRRRSGRCIAAAKSVIGRLKLAKSFHERPISDAPPKGDDARWNVGRLVADYLRKQRKVVKSGWGTSGPIVFEVGGTLNAGKDSLINVLKEALEDVYECRVRVIDEPMKGCRIGKEFSIDRLCKATALTVAQLYEARMENPGDYDFVIVNRGLFDLLAQFRAAHLLGWITEEQKCVHISYLLSYTKLQDATFLYLISPQESLQRQLHETRRIVHNLAKQQGIAFDWKPKFHNADFLAALNTAYGEVFNSHRHLFDKQVYMCDMQNWDATMTEADSIFINAKNVIETMLPNSQLPFPEMFGISQANVEVPPKRNRDRRVSDSKADPSTAEQLTLC